MCLCVDFTVQVIRGENHWRCKKILLKYLKFLTVPTTTIYRFLFMQIFIFTLLLDKCFHVQFIFCNKLVDIRVNFVVTLCKNCLVLSVLQQQQKKDKNISLTRYNMPNI